MPDFSNDPLLQSLSQMNSDLERRSAERKAAMAQATANVMQGLEQRQAAAERADAEQLAVSMSGRAGADYAKSKNPAARMAQAGTPAASGGEAGDELEPGGLEPSDLDSIASQEEEDSIGEQVGNRMSGRAVGEAALQQRKDGYRASEFEPFAGTEAQRGQARLAQAGNSAREGVNQADAMSAVRQQMSNGFTSANSPAAPTSMAPMSPLKQRMLAELEAAKTNPYRDPNHDQIMAQLSQIGPDGTMSRGPSPAAAQLDAAMAPVAQLAAIPPAPMPQIPPVQQMSMPPQIDPGLAAYMATMRPQGPVR